MSSFLAILTIKPATNTECNQIGNHRCILPVIYSRSNRLLIILREMLIIRSINLIERFNKVKWGYSSGDNIDMHRNRFTWFVATPELVYLVCSYCRKKIIYYVLRSITDSIILCLYKMYTLTFILYLFV